MDAETLVATLQAAEPDAQIERAATVDPQTTIYVSRDDVPALARALRDRPELAFDFLAELTAVDFWPKEPRYEVVYMLVSLASRLRLRMKVRLPADDPHVATVSGIWPVGISGTDRGILFLAGSASNIYQYFCQGTTGNAVGSINGSTTGTNYNTASSGELKEDLKSFDAGNIIDQTKVYDFAWKSTGERSYGVIAQQAIDVYPLAVTHVEKVSDEIGEFWGVDYSKYVPVLLQELKALRARVAQLEGGSVVGKPA